MQESETNVGISRCHRLRAVARARRIGLWQSPWRSAPTNRMIGAPSRQPAIETGWCRHALGMTGSSVSCKPTAIQPL
jgi:hypothetical protein